MPNINHQRTTKDPLVNHSRTSRTFHYWIVRAKVSYPGKTQTSCKWIKTTFRRLSTASSLTKYRLRFPRTTYWVKIRSISTLISWVNFKFSLPWTQLFCNNHRFTVNSLGKISSQKTWINLKNQTIKASIITTVITSPKWHLHQVS